MHMCVCVLVLVNLCMFVDHNDCECTFVRRFADCVLCLKQHFGYLMLHLHYINRYSNHAY